MKSENLFYVFDNSSAVSFVQINIKFFIKLLLLIIVVLFFGISFSEAKKKEKEKDCIYCKKYETMEDWPESERPAAFIYEEIDYPKGMFHESLVKSKQKQGEAGKKVYGRFVKGKSRLNKYQHLMIRDMAYFEALYNEMLNDKKAKV